MSTIEPIASAGTWTTHLEALKKKKPAGAAGVLIRTVLRAAMAGFAVASRIAARVPPRPLRARREILITGNFASANWALAHLEPLVRADRCGGVWIVTNRPMPRHSRVHAICPPRWAVKLFGETPARLVTFALAAIRRRPDVIAGFHLLVNALTAGLLARLVGARSLYFCVGGPTEVLGGGAFGENRWFGRLPGPDAVIERRLIRAVSAFTIVVTMGERAAGFFRHNGVARPVHVIPGGLDGARFQIASPPAAAELILVGRLVPVKRIDRFLRTIGLLAGRFPQIRARIVGDGPLRPELEQMARDLGIADRVVFAGHCEHVEAELRRASIFVLTSASEGVSLALMEAMMSGLPPVVPDVGDLRDVVEDGVNGFLVKEPSAAAFAEKIAALVCDPALRERFSAAARRTASRHEFPAVAARWNTILAGLDEPPQPPVRAMDGEGARPART
jgi:glycosyltransferase involved in cell wall biosynthesis